MKKYFASVVLILSIGFSVSICKAQQFQKAYGGSNFDICLSIQQVSDGGFICAGYTQSYGAGSQDVYLVKTDINGDTLWSRTYGGASFDAGSSVQQTNDGGYIIGASTQSFGAGGWDFYLIKTDGNGDTLWTRTFGGSGDDMGYSAMQTSDSGYIFTGITNTNNLGTVGDIYLVRTDKNGNLEWAKSFGGAGIEYGYSVQQTNDGGFIVAGSTNTYGSGGSDAYLLKTDGGGNLSWANAYGGTGDDIAYSVHQTSDNGYIIGGYTGSFGAGGKDFYLIKTNSTGDTLWTKVYGGADDDQGYSVQQTSDGGYIMAGYTFSFGAGSSDYYLVKTNGNGSMQWSEDYGASTYDYGYSICQTSDGGYAMGGYTENFGAGFFDYYIIKTDSSGNSGCNQGDPASIENGTSTIVTSFTPAIQLGTTQNYTGTLVGNGVTQFTQCASSTLPPVAAFHSSDTIFCANSCINFTDLSTNATSWQWNFSGGTPSSSTLQNPQTVCYQVEGNYNVVLIVTNANGSDTLTLTNFIVVHPAPPTPTITWSHDTLFCSSDSSFTSYQWYADSTLLSGKTDTFLVITYSGNYNVQVSNGFGCEQAVGINVSIGIPSLTDDNSRITISPNPAANELIITGKWKAGTSNICILNAVGQIVNQEIVTPDNDTSKKIDLSNLSSGIYFIQITDKTEKWLGRFIKE